MDLTLVCRYPIRRGAQADRDVCGATATYTDLTLTGAADAARQDGWWVDSVVAGTSAREDNCPGHYGRAGRALLPAAEQTAADHAEMLRRRACVKPTPVA